MKENSIRLMISGADRGPTTAAEQKEEETHGGCQKVGPKVAKFLDR